MNAAKTPPPSGSINSEETCRNALANAGFHQTEARLIERVWAVKSVKDLLAAFRNGTARTAALIDAQDAAALPAIAAHIEAQAERHRRGDELHIPIAAIVAAGRK
jgi:hypothetical protein